MTAALPVEPREATSAPFLAPNHVSAERALPDSDGDQLSLTTDLTLPALPPPAPQPTPAPRSPQPPASLVLRVPVLMYHYISAVPADQAKDPIAVDLRVPPDLFEQHLAYLRSQGYVTVGAPLLWEAMNGRAGLPLKPIVLTFDDGYADAYQNALPLLQKYGYMGTFFVTVNLIGKPGYLTWDQVRALDRAGMDIESHAMDHKPMTWFAATGLSYQMGDARKVLAQQLGHEVRFFAYPSGDYNPTAVVGAAANGYYGAFLKSGGALQSLDWQFMLRRSRVNGYATIDMLKVSLGR